VEGAVRTSAQAPARGGVARLGSFLTRHVDLRMGTAGALFLGTVVFAINASHGLGGASTAALKQAAYTFLAGGFVMRTCERIAVRGRRDVPAVAAGTLVASALAVGATFLVHSVRGTPEPAASTLPTALFAPPSFAVWGARCRRARRQEGG